MAWEFLKKIPSPLTVKKDFRMHGRWFEAGDSCNWMQLAISMRQAYKLIHDGFLEDPFKKDEPSKSESKRKKIQKKKKAGRKKKAAPPKEPAPEPAAPPVEDPENSEKPEGSEE